MTWGTGRVRPGWGCWSVSLCANKLPLKPCLCLLRVLLLGEGAGGSVQPLGLLAGGDPGSGKGGPRCPRGEQGAQGRVAGCTLCSQQVRTG